MPLPSNRVLRPLPLVLAVLLALAAHAGAGDGDLLAEARRLRAAGALAESADAFTRFLEGDPSAWQIRYELSQVLLTLRDLDGAETQLQQAILMVPGEAVLWARLGQVYLLKDDLQHAEQSLVRARNLSPGQAGVRYNLGLLYETMGDLEKAYLEYKAVLDVGGPEEIVSQSTTKAAQYLLMEDKPEQAFDCYRRSAELFPDRAWPHEQLAGLLFRLAHHDRALEEYEIVLKMNPEIASAHYNVAFVAKMKGDLERAEREMRTVLSLDPGSAKASYELGALLFEKGSYEEAAQLLSSSIAADPSDARAHYYYARTLLKLGRREEAKREMEIHAQLKRKDDAENPKSGMGLPQEDP